MYISTTLKYMICLRLGLNCGSGSIDFNSITVLSINQLKHNRMQVIGFITKQDKLNTLECNHIKFNEIL